MGHNLCLDIFGGPSDAEAAAGLPVHGEASVGRYELEQSSQALVQRALLPLANLRVERTIQLSNRSSGSRRASRTCPASTVPSAGPST